MNFNALKQLIILALCMVIAVLIGSLLASGDYDLMFLLAYAALGLYVLSVPGYVPLLAVGLLNPFVLPIPFVHAVPFMLVILGLCLVKFFFRNALLQHRSAVYPFCFTWSIALFFAWVALRYCMHPVLPNITGFGKDVTGFRSYLNYALCFAVVLFLPRFLPTRLDQLRLIHWLGGISLFFVLFLVPFIFSKSFTAARWLNLFGLYVTFFDNGWLRFVVVSGFGVILLTLAFMPNLTRLSGKYRFLMGVVGLTAIVVGGSRAGLVMAFMNLLAIALARRRLVTFCLLALCIGLTLLAFYIVGENLSPQSRVGFFRIMSLTSRRVAEQTDAAGSIQWRRMRWNRALQEIRNNPILGKGYGGLENAWLFTDWSQYEDAIVEVDLASGSIHNGFLAAAYALGLPAVLFFVFAMGGQILTSARWTYALRQTDPVLSDLHCFVAANLAGFLPSIYIGTDLNYAPLWFFLAWGLLLSRLPQNQPSQSQTIPAPPMPAPLPMRPVLSPLSRSQAG